jgi:hypothetical protein
LKETLKKFDRIAAKAAKDRAPFDLFALFLREGHERWELIVAAPWLSPHRRADFAYLIGVVRRVLSPDEWLLVPGITILDKHGTLLASILENIGDRRGFADVTGINLGGDEAKRAYIVEARENAAASSRPRKRRGPVTAA